MDRVTDTPQFFQASLRSKTAMMVTYISLAMLFASLVLGYTVYRFSSPAWPPSGFEMISLFWPGLSTIVILLSSLTMLLARKFYVEKKLINFRFGVIATIILGCGFLFAQWTLWSVLNKMGLFVSAGIFPSILHAFTWIHAAHIVVAILAVTYLMRFFSTKNFQQNKMITVTNIENFWHFLGVIWLIMFLILFII